MFSITFFTISSPLAALVGIVYILVLLHQIRKEVKQDMATVKEAVEALKIQVAETIGMDKSMIVYMQGIKQQLQDLINSGADPAELQALVDALDASEQEMAAAMAVNP